MRAQRLVEQVQARLDGVHLEFAHQLAWELGIHLEDVGGGRPPSVIFTGAPPPFAAQPLPTRRVRVTLLAAADVWKAYAVVPVKGGKQHR